MEQQISTSTVTVEYFDPHHVYKLFAPGLIPHLPLRNLHWKSHAGPLRSIDTLHVDLVPGGTASPPAPSNLREPESLACDGGFQTQLVGGKTGVVEAGASQPGLSKNAGGQRRHQIPGLRRTAYLKVLLVRCDDNESYKASVRSEIREWIKQHTPPSTSSKKGSNQEKHDAFEWLIVHVVIPNTAAATQPRSGRLSDTSGPEKPSAPLRWRIESTPLMEKLRYDFNSSRKGAPDRVAQIRIGINDVPYDLIPRIVPAVPSGYSETEQDAKKAWNNLMGKFKSLILSSFDQRVTQYEEDIKEKDGQRSLPGWNFCTFFILKEGLARGFESVGLVEDALVGYDELGVGLDSVIVEQATPGMPASHGGALLGYTEELKTLVQRSLTAVPGDGIDVEVEDLESKGADKGLEPDDIVISSTKKAYRDMILENKVSVFDFRCYIFSRQVALLLRLANASSTREQLLTRLEAQRQSVLYGVAPLAPSAHHEEETENLTMLAEICRRTFEFIPAISQIMRQDIMCAIQAVANSDVSADHSTSLHVADNAASSFAFAVAQQILAQTSARALPIPSTTVVPAKGPDQKASIPQPKNALHPARSSSRNMHRLSSPGTFPSPGRRERVADTETHGSKFLRVGLEDLAARRAELHMLCRNVLRGLGEVRGWSDGWAQAPNLEEAHMDELDEISLDDDECTALTRNLEEPARSSNSTVSITGIKSQILRTALSDPDDFYRLYEILTEKALVHFTVAGYEHAAQSCTADLACLKFHLKDYKTAANHFQQVTPLFENNGWRQLELSMLAMYSECLSELNLDEEFVRVTLDMLVKLCASAKSRYEYKCAGQLQEETCLATAAVSARSDLVDRLTRLVGTHPDEFKLPVTSFFTNIKLTGPPVYHDRRDGCSLSITLYSLLPGKITIQSTKMKVTNTNAGPCRELTFENSRGFILTPGENCITLDCNSVVSGWYRITQFALVSTKLMLHYDHGVKDPLVSAEVFKVPSFRLFRRTDTLDVKATANQHVCLDKNNSLDLELNTGWNTIESCEIRVRPATGGLRLLTREAKVVDSSPDFATPPEAGAFFFGRLEAGTTATIRFPYSVEHDLADVSVKCEVTYADQSGESFYMAKSLTMRVSLALGVSVQDVFKHESLFSRFTVSTATSSPIYLHESELQESELFKTAFGVRPTETVVIFPKQPASLLYRVTRKAGGRTSGGERAGKALYLGLKYTVLQTEAEDLMGKSVRQELDETPALRQFADVVVEQVLREMRKGVQAHDLERAALMGEMTTVFLEGIAWEKQLDGLGTVPGASEDASSKLAAVLRAWQKKHEQIAVCGTAGAAASILIPVEIPSLSVVHTADMSMAGAGPELPAPGVSGGSTPAAACVNQLMAATLHLKWTRIWDTDAAQRGEQEFAYEVTAPTDTWLLGGRRRGRFVIPAPAAGLSSTAETEAEIPLVAIPQRAGWLPFPTVEIREAVRGADGLETWQACEVDWRNLGETVRVVQERSVVTVSLDASGPGGGPLVLESEGMAQQHGARIVA